MEMVLLDGTPATCASIALHNLFAPDSFDFVISGPNFGRNTSSVSIYLSFDPASERVRGELTNSSHSFSCISFAFLPSASPLIQAFALSSGTLGAALAGSLSGTPGIALSWGLMEGYKPPGQELVDAAVQVSCDVIQRLHKLGWGEGANKVDVYSVNVPVSLFLALLRELRKVVIEFVISRSSSAYALDCREP